MSVCDRCTADMSELDYVLCDECREKDYSEAIKQARLSALQECEKITRSVRQVHFSKKKEAGSLASQDYERAKEYACGEILDKIQDLIEAEEEQNV